MAVKKAEMKFHPGMKNKKKKRVNTSSAMNFYNDYLFLIFDVCVHVFFLKLTCLNIIKV